MRGSEKTWKDLTCNFVHFLVSSYISILTFIDNNTEIEDFHNSCVICSISFGKCWYSSPIHRLVTLLRIQDGGIDLAVTPDFDNSSNTHQNYQTSYTIRGFISGHTMYIYQP
jgi:hypothetical protein